MIFIRKLKRLELAVIVFAVAALSGGVIRAEEQRYVSDRLTLRMYKDAALSATLPPLKSGDRVTIIERDQGYAQVKTDNGVVGWVRVSYLSDKKPAQVLLAETQKELDEWRAKHDSLLREQEAIGQPSYKQLQTRVKSAEAAQQDMTRRVQELEAERRRHVQLAHELGAQLEDQAGFKIEKKQAPLWIALPILIFIAGFLAGAKRIENKIRARFGGYYPW